MKYLKKFIENSQYNDKELMFRGFQEVFGFPLYHLTDRLVEWEDKEFNFVIQPVVWIKAESANKYDSPTITDFPDKSSTIKTYHFGLCRYRTEATEDDNIEVIGFPNNFDPNDVVAACIVVYNVFESSTYLSNYEEAIKRDRYTRKEFPNVINWMERQFDLIEIYGIGNEMSGAAYIGTILKRKND
jgi:hypothetical protein